MKLLLHEAINAVAGELFVVPAERTDRPVRDGQQQDNRAPRRLSGSPTGRLNQGIRVNGSIAKV